MNGEGKQVKAFYPQNYTAYLQIQLRAINQDTP